MRVKAIEQISFSFLVTKPLFLKPLDGYVHFSDSHAEPIDLPYDFLLVRSWVRYFVFKPFIA